jgi:hypothetical protein
MKNSSKEVRNRPAMAESTQDRGKFYLKLRTILIAIYIIGYGIYFFTDASPLPDYLAFLLALILIVGAIILTKKGSRHAAPRFVKLEHPPGVLFLRPFTEDTDWKIYYSWGRDQRPTSFSDKLKVLKFELKLQWQTLRRQAHFEFGELLAELTKSFGPIAAIGEPGSPPILGADNVYVSDENWQEEVLDLARKAKIVILTAGTTPGVIWETNHMIQEVHPSQLILNIPGGTSSKRTKNYKAFKAVAEQLFPKGLPQQLKARALTFKEDWTPVEDGKKEPTAGTSANVAWWMIRILP